MPRRTIKDESEARACLTSFADSGMDLRAWALAHGIDGRSLRAWRRRLEGAKGQPPEASPVRLVELVTAPTSGSSAAAVVVRVGRCEIELRAGFDDETLRRILRVAAEC